MKIGLKKVKTILLFTLFMSKPAIIHAEQLQYTISIPEPHSHYIEVEIRTRDIKESTLDFKLPVWAPGSYLVREFAGQVEAFKALDASGNPLRAGKIDKNTWRVNNKLKKDIVVFYKVYAFDVSVRTSYVDASHGYINGSSVFMYIDGKKDLSARIKIIPASSWKKITTALPISDAEEHTFISENYDILADCPIEMGNHEEFSFDAEGVKHTVAMYGEGNYEKEKIIKDFQKIVEVSTKIFGENPNKNYTFIIQNLSKSGGGLEHMNSTTLQVQRWNYLPRDNYINFLALAAHEYFHLWNVKRLRPSALGPFNYDRENYTTLLWVMEGFTNYYEDLLLRRAGIITKKEYLTRVEKMISKVENQPGNRVQSVAEASFDAWIKAYRPNENSFNTTISYYDRGGLVAMLLDLEIIQASEGKESLNDLMRYLYEEYYKKKKRGFTEDEFSRALNKIVGKDMSDFLNAYVYGTQTLPYKQYFSYAGLDFSDTSKVAGKAYLGAVTGEENGKLIVKNVISGTAAYEQGLYAKDEIIAMNGYRVDEKELKRVLEMKKPGDALELLVARDGKIQTVKMTLKNNPEPVFKIGAMKERNQAQQAVYAKWLGL